VQAQLRRGQALQQQLELQQLEPGSQFVLHLVVLLHLLVFAPQPQNQVLLGCSTDLQLVLRQLEQLEQQQVFVQPNRQVLAQGHLQLLVHLHSCCQEPLLALQGCMQR
jgi:hypothetical protein